MISNTSLINLLKSLGFSSTCVMRAVEELHGRPVPRTPWPPQDNTTRKSTSRRGKPLTDREINEAAMYAADLDLKRQIQAEASLMSAILSHNWEAPTIDHNVYHSDKELYHGRNTPEADS